MSESPPVVSEKTERLSKHEFFAKYYSQSLAILISVAAGIFMTDSRRQEAESALANLKAKNAETGALQISADVYQQSEYQVPALGLRRCTLGLSLSTTGEVPVQVKEIIVRSRKGALPREWVAKLIEYEEQRYQYSLVHRHDIDVPSKEVATERVEQTAIGNEQVNRQSSLFMITPTAPIWSEATIIDKLEYDKERGMIYPNQERPFSIDFLIADGDLPELVLVEVEIHIRENLGSDEQVRKWSTWLGTGPGLRCSMLQSGNLSSATCVPVN